MPYNNPSASLSNALALKMLTSFLNQLRPMSKELEEEVTRHIICVDVDKGAYLEKPISENRFIYFIVKGVVRSFIKSNGKEITTWMNYENGLISTIKTLGIEMATNEYLQALEKCTLIAFPANVLPDLYENFAEANYFGRKILEESYRSSELRSYLSRIPSALIRYRHFEANNAELLKRVPLKYIASFLGITLESLCRLRKDQRNAKLEIKL